MNASPTTRSQGMTLIELIVAMAISSVLLLALTQMLAESQRMMVRVDDGKNRSSSIRSAFSILSEDFGDLYDRGSRSENLVPLYVNPATGAQPAILSFLTVKEQWDSNASGGAGQAFDGVCAVSYRVVTTRQGGMLPGDLVRNYADASVTGLEILLRSQNGRAGSDVTWHQFLSDPGTSSIEEVVATSVVHFDVEPLRFQREAVGEAAVVLPVGAASTPAVLVSIAQDVPWPMPGSRPTVPEANDWMLTSPAITNDPTLPAQGPLDPDFSIPDVVRFRIVVASRGYFAALSDAQRQELASNVQRDLATDGRLDGKAGEAPLNHEGQLENLTLLLTSFALTRHL